MHDYHILVIDDNQALLQSLKIILSSSFSKVATLTNPQLIPAVLCGGSIDLILLDMNFDNCRLDGQEGLFWLEKIKSRQDAPSIILITAFGDISLAVEAMKKGADDFITTPWNNDTLIEKILLALKKKEQEEINDSQHSASENEISYSGVQHLTLEETEKLKIKEVLQKNNRNMTLTAMQLGITRRTLYNKIEKYEL